MKNVSPISGISWEDCIKTDPAGKKEPSFLTENDVLLTARGSQNFATPVGCAPEVLNEKAVAAPHFFVITPKTKHILPEFIAWLLNQPPTQRYFTKNAEGSLTKSIRRNVLEDTPVVIPPLEKQTAIIGMANALHKERQLMHQLIHNGEQVMSAIAYSLYE